MTIKQMRNAKNIVEVGDVYYTIYFDIADVDAMGKGGSFTEFSYLFSIQFYTNNEFVSIFKQPSGSRNRGTIRNDSYTMSRYYSILTTFIKKFPLMKKAIIESIFKELV